MIMNKIIYLRLINDSSTPAAHIQRQIVQISLHWIDNHPQTDDDRIDEQ